MGDIIADARPPGSLTSYGLVTLIFQDGRLRGLLGFTSYGAIVSWVPLFMIAWLIGRPRRDGSTT